MYRSSLDTRNTLLWQPTEKSLQNVELDEAGKLAAFRAKFGRAFDLVTGEDGAEGEAAEEDEDGFADLLSNYSPETAQALRDSGPKKTKKKR